MENLEKRIIDVLSEVKPNITENLDRRFVEEGILDSLDMMNLIMKLEGEFEIMIDPEDVISEYFETVEAIARLVERCGKR